ncbi:hypothetical protein B0T22DRAFT_477626 [Podospora appendiculata]|uniref:Tat pathway signal sequence n=1 Tax=Podospora appendiculata TaxID=314037 RepID=A0AAE1CHU6_9PEZI|nr:hypothetical protein B0T22DRAFT_477626 [Podospora appendiculata]
MSSISTWYFRWRFLGASSAPAPDAGAGDHEPFICHSDMEPGRRKKLKRSGGSLGMVCFMLLGFFAGGALLMAASSFAPQRLDVDGSAIIQRVSIDSPILHDINLRQVITRFNGSFFHADIFRQDAGPRVDEAWESLGVEYRPVVVPDHLASRSGLSESHVRVSEVYGGGYLANVEGLHHLHCLNLIRKAVYFNYDYYKRLGEKEFSNGEAILRPHITHCIDIIRQQLMCVVDVGVMGQVWWDPEDPKAFPDFGTRHKCRDFEAVRAWAKEHQVPDELPTTADKYLRPPRKEDVLRDIP